MLFNIIGFGFVGQATGISLSKMGHTVHVYELVEKKNIYKDDEFDEIAQIIGEIPNSGTSIVCIKDKTLSSGKQNIAPLKKVLEKLKGTIILRTTILPRLLKELKFDFYWPEFLHERKALEEFMNPQFTVVGRRGKENFPIKGIKNINYFTPEEASHIKYLSNIWNAMRIAFVNEFGDNLKQEKVNKDKVIDFFFKKEKYLKWGNAYGGHCLPKDVKAYLREYGLLFTKATDKANSIHYKKYPKLKCVY
jgi:UDP-glucose 6-dehydrogenase